TVMFTVAPAGITAPFSPVTALSSVAVTWSPTAFVLVQIFDEALVFSVAPAGIMPTAPPPVELGFDLAPGFDVTVLPLAVVVGVDGAGAELLGRGAGRDGVVVRGRVGAGVVAGGGSFGMSFSDGWVPLSRFASARSRFSVVSAPSAVLSVRFASERHAPSS